MALSGVYKHLTGKQAAQQKFLLGDVLVPHPVYGGFYDDGNLIEIPAELNKASVGLPVPEGATDATKVIETGMGTVIVAVTGSTADLPTTTTRVITATLKRNGVTETQDDTTVVTFAKVSGTGTVTGLGTATATNGVATKTVTGGTLGSLVLSAAAPGHTTGTITFTVVA